MHFIYEANIFSAQCTFSALFQGCGLDDFDLSVPDFQSALLVTASCSWLWHDKRYASLATWQSFSTRLCILLSTWLPMLRFLYTTQ